MKNKPSALYIHIPFCQKICDYCDFPKLQYFRFLAECYIASLLKEIDQVVDNKELKTIYVGGGTPTALEDDLFEMLFKHISEYAKHVEEYTVEANPESLTERKLQIMKKYGVNRISLGVQSTDDKILKSINRVHTFEDVKTAILSAKKIGFDNLNVDLIIGLPHVSKALFLKDLNNILALDVKHISCYSLTVHPNTVFFIKGVNEPSEELSRELYEVAHQVLKEYGFEHYEISNWAKPGFCSKHNLTYWKDEQYYGVGLGAAGYIKDIRYKNTTNFEKYCDGHYIDEKETVSIEDDKEYYIMLNLRTAFGIDIKDYQNRFGENFLEKYKEPLESNIQRKLLCYDEENGKIYPTFDGMMVLDQIVLDLIN